MSDPYLAEVRLMAFDFAPKGWAKCDGQLLAINQNQATFALMGTTYGGDGQTTFALPNLRGRIPLHWGNALNQGTIIGQEAHTLTIGEMFGELLEETRDRLRNTTQAREAAAFYCDLFPESHVDSIVTLKSDHTPTGDCDVVAFTLHGQRKFFLLPAAAAGNRRDAIGARPGPCGGQGGCRAGTC